MFEGLQESEKTIIQFSTSSHSSVPDMPLVEFDVGIGTNNNNGLKFLFSSLLFYPLVECLLDRFILKLAALRALAGENPHLRYTRLGFFGPNTVYWGSRRWRAFILAGALIYSCLQLAGEFGFGSRQVDIQERGTFRKRAFVTDPRFHRMSSLDVRKHGPLDTGDALMCFLNGDLSYRLSRSPYPNEFRFGTLQQKINWYVMELFIFLIGLLTFQKGVTVYAMR